MSGRQLSSSQREFLSLVSEAVFANPFGARRAELDGRLSGRPGAEPRKARFQTALARIRKILHELTDKRLTPATIKGPDHFVLANAHLFDVFHACLDDLDRLIQRQLKAGDGVCPAPFAAGVLHTLASRGFSDIEARRFFAMFYQLRRAFYFANINLIGAAPCMQRLRMSLWDNIFTSDTRLYERHLWNRMEDFSTLILGETGAGKGAAASALGRSGFIPFDDRHNAFAESFMRSFMAINLSQFPETLIESELFGHRKGAFTGAIEAHEGIFARCSPHGAIFLDEIGDVTIPVQIKLLHVIQDRVFSPVGSHEKRRFQGRVIAASNKPINRLRREGTFRDDFFYRLCSDVITVPPLRVRIREDRVELDLLVRETLRRILGSNDAELVPVVLDAIRRELGDDYAWPGNVRELEQGVRRILLTGRYAGDTTETPSDAAATIQARLEAGDYSAQTLMADYCALLFKQIGTYEGVARRVGLDRRTVKKHVDQAGAPT